MSLGEAVHELACIRGTGDELGCQFVGRGDVVVGEGWSEGELALDEVHGSPHGVHVRRVGPTPPELALGPGVR